MSAPINYLNDSEEEELGALIYKSSQTAKKFLGLGSSASAPGGASGGASKAGPRHPADDCPARDDGCKLIHESSFRYSLRSSSKKLKVEEATDESKCTGDHMLQQKQSQASELKWASSDSESDNENDSSDDEYLTKPPSSITSHTTSKRHNLRRASHRHASNGATEPEPECISSAASTTPPSLSSRYCAVIDEDRESAEIEGTYTDRKGREFVIERFAGKKYKHYCKPEDVNKTNPRAIRLCKHPGCARASRKGGICVKHDGGKNLRCKVEGCTNQKVANHLCYRHGAPRKICKHNGCTNIVKGRGVCARHGYKQRRIICKHEGCQSLAQKGGICFKHTPSGYRKCKVEGCHKNVRTGGKCRGHAPCCKVAGCTNQKVANHLCYRHGAPRKICKHNGCTNIVKGRGVCARHGYKQRRIICKHEGCQSLAQKGGICFKHTPSGYRKCKVEGCNKIVRTGGKCRGHAPSTMKPKLCKNEGCTAKQRGLCTEQAKIVSMTAAV